MPLTTLALMRGHKFPVSHQIQHLLSGSIFICNTKILVCPFLLTLSPSVTSWTCQGVRFIFCHSLLVCAYSVSGSIPYRSFLSLLSSSLSHVVINSKTSIIFCMWMIFPLKISHKFRCWMSCQQLQLNASLVKLIISLSSQLFLLGCLALLMTPSSVTKRLKMSHINFNFFFSFGSISTSKCLLHWSHPFYACCHSTHSHCIHHWKSTDPLNWFVFLKLNSDHATILL